VVYVITTIVTNSKKAIIEMVDKSFINWIFYTIKTH
jgi:hypothetical protein